MKLKGECRMKNHLFYLGCLLFSLLVLSCRYVTEYAEKAILGDMPMTKVGKLWKDVPQLEEAKPIQMEEIPLAVKLVIGLILKQGGYLEEGEKIEWIAFETNKSVEEVKETYSAEKMKNLGGWVFPIEEVEPCKIIQDTSDKQQSDQALGCVFEKEVSGEKTILLILNISPETAKNGMVFYIKIHKPKKV